MFDCGVSNWFFYIGEMVCSELIEKFGEYVIDFGYKVYIIINSEC